MITPSRLILPAATCIALASTHVVQAQISIAVTNHSFENPPVSAVTVDTAGTGWTVSRPTGPGSATGLVPNGVTNYPNTPYGDQYLFITGRKSNQDGIDAGLPNRVYRRVIGGVDQPVVLDGYTYTLTVSLANLTNPQNFSFGLYSNTGMTEVLAVRDNSTITLSSEEWLDFSVLWTGVGQDMGNT